MSRIYSLAQLMALPYSPAEMIRLAAETGCAGAGIRMLPTAPGGQAYPLMDDAVMLRETLAAIADTGVKVFDLEVVRIGAAFDVRDFQRFIEIGAQIGAAHILVAGDDPDEARLTASYAALCDAAAPFGLSADLEFMPWTAVPNLRSAKRIVGAAARPNGGVLVDALHFARSGSRLDELDDIPRAWLHYAQICDGAVPGPDTVEGLIHDARCERLLPGEGGIDLRALFARLPADLPVSIEVPSDSRAPQVGYPAWAARAKADTLAVLGERA
ncbi:Xylose isomerase domain protein TIM barrel [Leptothrix cholodnii SP-6]|uniref:Xylose isomerase domain protein TIM barrel n=1 Tax=Leptothrix cholodnii (strain ATCC 51168 / LMG 8142 / SP-6) TaxID=395495 RepID=B1Y597_LEPCP|nr:sugar phosphate isomerase/epimerase [Leptothrix cholodnii]ACB33485.1 Xylose isomerase domain protein TIM barrel [Leptothrix cholodnii SP-6]